MVPRALVWILLTLLFLATPALARQSAAAGRHQGRLPAAALRMDTVGGGAAAMPRLAAEGIVATQYSLTLSDDLALGGSVFKGGYVFLHNGGGLYNTALGLQALAGVTTGARNTAVGEGALGYTTDGGGNTAVGFGAQLRLNGENNSAFGSGALLGYDANSGGDDNVALGFGTLRVLDAGNRNVAIGAGAGNVLTQGSDNILIQNNGGDESNTLRIGVKTGTGAGELSRAFIAGIRNAAGSFPDAVCVNANDQLGPCSLNNATQGVPLDLAVVRDGLRRLELVRFEVSREIGGEPVTMEQVGLAAEEVARVFPAVVSYDEEGRARGVRHDLLTPLLLAEVKRQDEELSATREQLGDQAQLLDALRRRLDRLEAEAFRRSEGGRWIPTSSGGD